MKKVLIGLGIFIGVVIIGFYICKLTGMYRLHTCVTTANEPALPLNSMFASSNLKDEKPGDLITFQQDTAVYIFRFVAKEGDVVLIKNGRLYVNDADFDSKIATKHGYLVSPEQLSQLNPQPYAIPNANGKYMAFLEDAVADRAGLADHKYIAAQNEADPDIVKIYGKGWNKDFFGPLTIPKNKVFVLGDNRDNAYDSRYLGLIDTDKIAGVVLKK